MADSGLQVTSMIINGSSKFFLSCIFVLYIFGSCHAQLCYNFLRVSISLQASVDLQVKAFSFQDTVEQIFAKRWLQIVMKISRTCTHSLTVQVTSLLTRDLPLLALFNSLQMNIFPISYQCVFDTEGVATEYCGPIFSYVQWHSLESYV